MPRLPHKIFLLVENLSLPPAPQGRPICRLQINFEDAISWCCRMPWQWTSLYLVQNLGSRWLSPLQQLRILRRISYRNMHRRTELDSLYSTKDNPHSQTAHIFEPRLSVLSKALNMLPWLSASYTVLHMPSNMIIRSRAVYTNNDCEHAIEISVITVNHKWIPKLLRSYRYDNKWTHLDWDRCVQLYQRCSFWMKSRC